MKRLEIGFMEQGFKEIKTNAPRYLIVFRQYSEIRLITESLGHYKLCVEDLVVDVFEQKNRKLGLFIKSNQVGLITYHWNDIDTTVTYDIFIASKIIDKELVIGFVLAFDNYFNKNEACINFISNTNRLAGNKAFDLAWRPKM